MKGTSVSDLSHCKKHRPHQGVVTVIFVYEAPKNKFGRIPYLCKWCILPNKESWDIHKQECEGCFSEFSSPYTMEYCRRCSLIEEEEFFGWPEVVALAR